MNLFENQTWGKVKGMLLENLPADKKVMVSTLLENQKRYLMETAASGTVAANAIGNFQKIVIPMIRRVIPGTIATELVGVQPMSGPVALVYSLRYAFAETVAATASSGTIDGGANDDITAGDELFGNNSKTKRFYTTANVGTTGYPPALTANTSNGLIATTADYEGFGGRAITLEVLKQTVTAGSRKLQARFTPESMQDLQASHGLDMETELTTGLSAAIVSEIDNEIINDLIALAGTAESFDMNATTFTGVPTYVGDRHAVLGVLISKVANEIARKTRIGAANWIVVSPLVATVLQSASKSVFAPAVAGSFEGPNNTKLIGTLNGSIKVYSYIYHDQGSESILLGLKSGSGELGAGYFYCPYIPVESSGAVTDPNTFNTHMSLMTRYAKASFTSGSTSLANSADYYGKITVANLAFI